MYQSQINFSAFTNELSSILEKNAHDLGKLKIALPISAFMMGSVPGGVAPKAMTALGKRPPAAGALGAARKAKPTIPGADVPGVADMRQLYGVNQQLSGARSIL